MLNPIAIVILAAIVIDAGLNYAADVLNLRDIRKKLPGTFEGWYPPDAYRKSQEYLKVNTRFGWIVGSSNLLLLLIFWFAGGFAWLDVRVRDLGWPMVWSGLIYIGILLGIKSLLAIPFNMYATFVIEERFGFNQTTWGTFLKDRIKSMALIKPSSSSFCKNR